MNHHAILDSISCHPRLASSVGDDVNVDPPSESKIELDDETLLTIFPSYPVFAFRYNKQNPLDYNLINSR
jgi:hypothetical protein